METYGLCQIKGLQWRANAWLLTEPVDYLAQKAVQDYGPIRELWNHNPPSELTESELEKACKEKLQQLQIQSLEQIQDIQRKTIGQHGNVQYEHFIKDRLTASQFGMVCKRRKTTPCHNHVKQILYKQDYSNEIYTTYTTYGQTYEKAAIKLFAKKYNKTVILSGLFIDHEYGFLGASPDGLVVGENAVVEVKCFPSLAEKGITFEDAALEKKSFPLKMDINGHFTLDKKHNFYYQIQGQLRASSRDYCYLICFIDMATPILTIKVQRDEAFIQQMLQKLVAFYKTCVLPEIVLRRVPANQTCRDPPTFVGSHTNHKEKRRKFKKYTFLDSDSD